MFSLKLQFKTSIFLFSDLLPRFFSFIFSRIPSIHSQIKIYFPFCFQLKNKRNLRNHVFSRTMKSKGKTREKFATILSSTWNWASHAYSSGPILLLFEQAKCNNICYIISTLKEGKSCAGIIDFLITFPWPEITKFSQCYFLVIFGKFIVDHDPSYFTIDQFLLLHFLVLFHFLTLSQNRD